MVSAMKLLTCLSYYYKIALENKGTFISCSIQFDQHYYISYDRISMLFPVIDVVENNQARFLDTFKDIEILNIITWILNIEYNYILNDFLKNL